MTEWGVFSDEGCVEAGLWSQQEAEEAASSHRANGDDTARAARICPDHEEQEEGNCDECLAVESDE